MVEGCTQTYVITKIVVGEILCRGHHVMGHKISPNSDSIMTGLGINEEEPI